MDNNGKRMAVVIPQPVEMVLHNGTLPIFGDSPLQVSPPFESVAQLLKIELERHAFANCSTSSQTSIRLLEDKQLSSEAYTLKIDEQGVELAASAPQGMLYALQTLRQLLFQYATNSREIELPYIEVKDAPRFAYRGMHLDVSRHFFDVDFVKKYIDLIALHKMNHFHWHLTDDQGWRIEIKRYPRLVEVGSRRKGTVVGHTLNAGAQLDGVEHSGYYTQEQIREVIAYAAERHITVIPEIDVPGHAAALIAAYPEFGCGPTTEVKPHFGIFKHVLCPSEETFTFLEHVFSEVAELFPGPYIHIGGDEVVKDHWRDCARCREVMRHQDIADMDQLQAYFINRVEKIVNRLGKRIIGWDEILDGDVNPSATVMSWRGMEGGIKASQNGHEVIMTPLDHVYFDFYQSTSVDEPPAIHGLTRLRDVWALQLLPEHLDEQARSKILGGQANLWTEYVASENAVERMILPRMTALAEVLWSPVERQELSNFIERLETFMPLLATLGYQVSDSHYKPELSVAPLAADLFQVSMEAERGAIYYTLDGSVPSTQSRLYEEPFTLNGGSTIRARTWLDDRQQWYGDSRITINAHKAVGSHVTLAENSEIHSDANAADILVDGITAQDRLFHQHEWVGIGRRLDAEIELPQRRKVSRVTLGINGLHRQLHRPTEVSVYAGEASGGWTLVGYLNQPAIHAAGNLLVIAFESRELERLRLVVGNDTCDWSAEKESIQPATVYIDEICID